VPAKSEFPGTGPNGNGISEKMKSQAEWIGQVKTSGCEQCHQMGDKATREIPENIGRFGSSAAAWDRVLQSSQFGGSMVDRLTRIGRVPLEAALADWTDRIAAGQVPPQPRRPEGIERNVVISEWDWGGPREYFHDQVSTDKRSPSINAGGPVYGVHEHSSDYMTALDPVHNSTVQIPLSVRDSNTGYDMTQKALKPSPYWGEEAIFRSRSSAHSFAMDDKGRVWFTSTIRPPDNPAFCKQGSSHPSAKLFPLNSSSRQLSVYDPRTKQVTLIDTCFQTIHLQFTEDGTNTLWFSGDGDVAGWFNTKLFDESHDEAGSQGWTPLILDTNGNGRRDEYTEPGMATDPAKDKRIRATFYSIMPNPVDGSIWGAVPESLPFPGAIIRIAPGPNPPTTALAEIYEPPWNNSKAPVQGYSPRGIDIDSDGVVWTNLSGSSQFASFDRRKCKILNGPNATGQHCPEGWKLYPMPGPHFMGITEFGNADGTFYDWVDKFDILGLGKNVPILTAIGSDSLQALLPNSGKFVVLRVPYPMGFYAKTLDGRVDNPKDGWKGKGVWSVYSDRGPWLMEGAKGTVSKAVKFQLRPDPLAR